MTLEDLKNEDTAVITPVVAAEFLGCDPHWLRLVARQQPERLGFPVCCVRSRVKIPRIPFINFLTGGNK